MLNEKIVVEYPNKADKKDKRPKEAKDYSNVLIQEDDLKKMVQTESIIKIANKYNVTPYVIIKICKMKNIEIPDKHYLLKKFEISREDLENLIRIKPMVQIGKMFGVSDNAVRKRCEKMGVDWKGLSGFSHSKISLQI